MYVYGEVVIGLNFMMNSLILILTAYITGREFSWPGIFAAALFGSIYALGEAAAFSKLFYSMPVKLTAAAVMVYLSFGYKTIRSFVLMAAMFFIVSFILGGAVIGWLYFLQDQVFSNGALEIDFTKLIIGVLVAVGLIFLTGRYLSTQVFRRKNSYLFTVRYKDRQFTGKGFLDTGNFLYSPVGRRPVILLSKEAFFQILPQNVADYFQETIRDNWIVNLSDCQDEKWLSRVEIIPYAAIGTNDVLLGFRPDEVIIFDAPKTLSTPQIVVAIADAIFDDDGFSALLHPAILDNGKWLVPAGEKLFAEKHNYNIP